MYSDRQCRFADYPAPCRFNTLVASHTGLDFYPRGNVITVRGQIQTIAAIATSQIRAAWRDNLCRRQHIRMRG